MNALPKPRVRYQVKVTYFLPDESPNVEYIVPITVDSPIVWVVRDTLVEALDLGATEVIVTRIEVLQVVPAII